MFYKILHVLKTIDHLFKTLISKFVLILSYFLVLTPLSLCFKILRKDPLDKKICKKRETYRIAVLHDDHVERMKFPF